MNPLSEHTKALSLNGYVETFEIARAATREIDLTGFVPEGGHPQ